MRQNDTEAAPYGLYDTSFRHMRCGLCRVALVRVFESLDHRIAPDAIEHQRHAARVGRRMRHMMRHMMRHSSFFGGECRLPASPIDVRAGTDGTLSRWPRT